MFAAAPARRPVTTGLAPALKPVPLALALLLAACGGGGGTGSDPVVQPAPQPVVLRGVAATGAPMAQATVRVFDASGATVCSTSTDSGGRYSCDLGTTPLAPFTVQAQAGSETLYSAAAVASSATVNVTPLTNLIVARLAPNGDPATLVDAVRNDHSLVSAGRLQAGVAEVAAMLAPLTTAAGDSTNPISGSFAADGTGHDKVLDTLQINIRPEATVSNIQITLKVQPASDTSAPVELSFKSNEAAPPPPAITLRPADLPPDNIAAGVAGFFQRMQACYALPLATRVAGVAAGAVTASGNAASVQAPACRTLFVGDDPAGFLDNGLRVGSGGAFAGLFRESSTGARFEEGRFEYRWASGDLFVTFRSTTTSGAVAHQTMTLRESATGLKAVGNQYAYDANVRPYAVDREFPLQPAFSYLGTGYNAAIANRIDPATGQPMFTEVRVTMPNGRQMLYRPQAARSLLGIVRSNGTTSGTSVELVASAYRATGTPGSPAEKDGGFLFAAQPLGEDQLRGIPDQGAWTFEFVHADSSRPNVVQAYRTVSRAATLGELRQAKFVQFSDAQKQTWTTRADVAAFSGLQFGTPSAAAPNRVLVGTADGMPGWTAEPGATLASSVTVFGSTATGGSFNDTASVISTDRSATVQCSTQSAGDLHCDSSTGTTQYAAGGRIWTVELWGRTLRQLEMAKHLAWFRLAE